MFGIVIAHVVREAGSNRRQLEIESRKEGDVTDEGALAETVSHASSLIV